MTKLPVPPLVRGGEGLRFLGVDHSSDGDSEGILDRPVFDVDHNSATSDLYTLGPGRGWTYGAHNVGKFIWEWSVDLKFFTQAKRFRIVGFRELNEDLTPVL